MGCALAVGEVPEDEQAPWRASPPSSACSSRSSTTCSTRTALAAELGVERTHELAAEIEQRARARLAEIPADTSLLDELVSGLKSRAAAS